MTTDEVQDHAREVAESRRALALEQSLEPEPVDINREQRDLQLVRTSDLEDSQRVDVVQEHGITGTLENWLDHDHDTVQRYVGILETIQSEECTSMRGTAEAAGEPGGTVRTWMGDDSKIGGCVRKVDGAYQLTPVGRKAVEAPWGVIFSQI